MKQIHVRTIFALLGAGLVFNLVSAEDINFLDPAHFSFENGGTAIYYQQTAEYWSVSSDRSAGSGSYSLRFTSTDPVPSTQKAKYGTADAGINLPAGEYTVRVKVWLSADADIKGFNFNIKVPWTVFAFKFDTIAREEWVELSLPASFDSDLVHSGCIIRVDTAHVGTGTMYLDDFEIWGEKPPEPQILPLISSIKTTGEASLNLSPGVYGVNMKVWKDTGTTISTFHSTISGPWALMQWEIDTVTPGNWTVLNQELLVTDTVSDATFALQVNNDPVYGGGTGTMYLDDIEFIRLGDFIPVSGLSLSETAIILNRTETFALDHLLMPFNASDTAVLWLSSDPYVSTVNTLGMVTAMNKGTTVISVFSKDSYMKATCQVQVIVAVDSINISNKAINLQVGEQYELTATIFPDDADNKEMEWISEEDTIASVDRGMVTGLSAGTTLISVSAVDGNHTAQCQVTVADSTTFLSETEQAGLKLLPNPFTSRICIIPEEAHIQQLRLYNLSGVLLMERNITGQKTIWLSPSYTSVPQGMYLLRLFGEEDVRSIRIIRE